jgi:predicted lysophospholipase L1 biosynthesis ABC-type transport system permease subunit
MPVAVVSEAFERKLLGGATALGVRVARGPQAPAITIVGVVRDVRRDGRTSDIRPQVYLPAAQTSIYPVRLSELAVRAAAGGSVQDLLPAIRSAIWSVDADQPITNIRTLDEILIADSAERRFQTLLFGIFAALALVLASIGTYGVINYLISQRTPEIGVRIALGASRGRIYRWLLGRTAVLVVAGSILGIASARLLARFVETMLFEVAPSDPSTYALAAGVLSAVALLASTIAVRRAARISPTVALRYE